MALKEGDNSGSVPCLSAVPGVNETLVVALADGRVTHVHHLLAWPEAELARTTGVQRAGLHSAYRAVHASFGARRQSGLDFSSRKRGERQMSCQLRPELRCAAPSEMCHACPGDIVEICGGSGSGKTQMCLTVAAAVAAEGQGVLLLDSAGSMDIARISDVLRASGLEQPDVENALDLIYVIPAGSPEAADAALDFLINDLLSIAAVYQRETKLYPGDTGIAFQPAGRHSLNSILRKLALVVFDSPAAILSPVLGWRLPDGWTGHAFSNRLASQLRTIASSSNAVVLMTNRLVHGERDRERRVALGRSWLHVADTRVFLEESHSDLADCNCLRFTRRISSRRSGIISPTTLCLGPGGLAPAPREQY
jgi:RAD51-like protein 3